MYTLTLGPGQFDSPGGCRALSVGPEKTLGSSGFVDPKHDRDVIMCQRNKDIY